MNIQPAHAYTVLR